MHPAPRVRVAAQPPSSLERGKHKPFPGEGVNRNRQLDRTGCLLHACAAWRPPAERASAGQRARAGADGASPGTNGQAERAERCWARHHPGISSERLVLAPPGDISPAAAGAGDVSPAAPGQRRVSHAVLVTWMLCPAQGMLPIKSRHPNKCPTCHQLLHAPGPPHVDTHVHPFRPSDPHHLSPPAPRTPRGRTTSCRSRLRSTAMFFSSQSCA